uniref:Uncharacterized protein n=1 Tax=Anguilla anguilla TaxID=7936 RepID=A0A0E9UED6_ANGAN
MNVAHLRPLAGTDVLFSRMFRTTGWLTSFHIRLPANQIQGCWLLSSSSSSLLFDR